MTVLVTAATGNVGHAVVRDLVAHGVPVRAVTRDPTRARQILGDAPEIVGLDLTDRSAVDAALRGVDRVFLASANHPGQVQAECAVVDAAAAAGVGGVVKLSGPRPHPDSPLVIEQWHAQIEAHLLAAPVSATVLRPASFMTNLLAFTDPVRQGGVLPAPTAGARVAFVDPADVGAVAARLLSAPALPGGRVLRLTGPAAVSYEQVASAISAATSRPVAFVPVTDEQAAEAMRAAGLPEAMVEVFGTVYRMQREGLFADATDTVATVLGRSAADLTAFLARYRSLFVPTAHS